MVKLFSRKGREFYLFLRRCVGYFPSSISLFQLAFIHKSSISDLYRGRKIPVDVHNERLEYLGDAVLGALVADILCVKYPDYDEGKLTKMRSLLVSRRSLNVLSKQLGLTNYIKSSYSTDEICKSHIPGDVFEAFVAAIYLDGGFPKVKRFVEKTVVSESNIKRVSGFDDGQINYKSKIIEWGHTVHREIVFDTHYVEGDRGEFVSSLKINGVIFTEGFGMQKKQAEQEASRIALERCETWADDSDCPKSEEVTTEETIELMSDSQHLEQV